MKKFQRKPVTFPGLCTKNHWLLGVVWDNGAMRETVKHGETGFLVRTQEEMENLIRSDLIVLTLGSPISRYLDMTF